MSELSICLRTKSPWKQTVLDVRGDDSNDKLFVLDPDRGVKQIINFKKGKFKYITSEVVCEIIIFIIVN